ncbi:penicillin-binding protein [Bacillus oleivorans]|uniref:serine-type D-Ala-D-Ala carboxypeptidase n=1 Tax=Bacillus oleivorans TaxID=1448271 RepID=A0A285CSN1_9BACI|nr:penicillin-binding transpeptidase domain-containing protein [Bacillus oleivorans]SNX70599.1 penicillin-binding protein [Bacillus oleivorans]
MKKLICVLFMLLVTFFLSACNNEPTAQGRFKEYIKLWNEQKFAEMYDFLTADAKQRITKEEFVGRYEKVYGDLEISDLKVTTNPPKEEVEGEEADFSFSAEMNSLAGPISFQHSAPLKKEERNDAENWYVHWDTTFIFPELGAEDKIRLTSTPSLRGEIVDRFGNGIAMNGTAYEIGIVPGQMEGKEQEIISQISELLGVSPERIQEALNADWVQPDYFVPIKKISTEETELLAAVTSIPSVVKKDVPARVYPYKEAAAHLVGYVGPITAEELEELSGKGYTSSDVVGKRGMEQVLEERLKGENGAKIYIEKADGSEVVLAEKEAVNGENVALTIDMNLQTKIYNELNGEPGTGIALHPLTGETLALVSSPSFNPNTATLGATGQFWQELEENPLKPLTTRFKQRYAPGSVMKPITAAIGLNQGAITPDWTIDVNGLQWQKDSSWGDYKVTRVKDTNGPVNLDRALIVSDNIYFAQAALQIGAQGFTEGLTSFGFGEEIDYPFPLDPGNIGDLENEIRLADSGYGQGQIEMNIVHLAAAYTPFLNKGTMLRPTLLAEQETSQPWKENLVNAEIVNQINTSLRKVIEDRNGTAKTARIDGYPLAGKTGTAEIKEQQGVQGKENGWFIAYNLDNPELLIAMMVEGVQDKGGSEAAVSRVRNVIASQR